MIIAIILKVIVLYCIAVREERRGARRGGECGGRGGLRGGMELVVCGRGCLWAGPSVQAFLCAREGRNFSPCGYPIIVFVPSDASCGLPRVWEISS